MSRVRIDVDLHGPIFNGMARAAVRDYVEDVKKRVAEEGKADVDAQLPKVLRHPTGRYQRQINVKTRGRVEVVNDRGIIYGPWLEGVGSRNRTTRFKGYFTFRRVGQALRAKAGHIAEEHLPPYLVRMGGRR